MNKQVIYLQIPQLNITKTMPQIDARTERGSFDIESHTPQIELDYGHSRPYQRLGSLEMETPSAQFDIDLTKPYEDLGVRKFHSLIRFMKNKWYKKTLAGIAEFAREGDQLGQIGNARQRIAQLAKKELDESQPQLALKSIPENPPDVKAVPGQLKVSYQKNQISVSTNFEFPTVKVNPAKLNIYLAQEGNINIEIINNNIDMKI